MNILFTCAGRRNYLINYFREALAGRGEIIAADVSLLAPALADADRAVRLPPVAAGDYIDELESVIRRCEVDAVISLNDLELPVLSAARERLERFGARVLISDPEVIDICFDKWKTARFLETHGMNCPKTYLSLDDARAAIRAGELRFPVVIKPRWGSASIGIEFPEDLHELELAHELLVLRLRRTILASAGKKDSNQTVLIQEHLGRKEYGLDIVNSLDGDYHGTYAREKLVMRAGETDKARSVIDPRFEELGSRLGRALHHIGNLDCDVMEHDGRHYILEMNARFGGGYPFSHEAGVNTAAMYIEWLYGNREVSRFDDYRADLIFAKCDRMMRVGLRSEG